MGSAAQVLAYFDDLHRRHVKEVPDGSNCCEVTQEYGPIGSTKCYAWCAATCYNGCKRAGVPAAKTALVAAWKANAQAGKNGLIWVPKNGEISAGDFVTYDWKGAGSSGDMHIAIVVNPGTQAKFETIGGNEDNRVMRQWRDRTFVMGFVRPPYDAAPTPPQQEDWFDMATKEELLDVVRTVFDEREFDTVANKVAAIEEQVNHNQEVNATWEPIILHLPADLAAIDQMDAADVDKLATALASRLGDDVAKALGERLANG